MSGWMWEDQAYIPGTRSTRKRTPIPGALVREVFARDGLCCRYCAWTHPSSARFQIDHVLPWCYGGLHELENLVVCCIRCNKRKGTEVWKPLPLAEMKRRAARSRRGAERSRQHAEARAADRAEQQEQHRKQMAKQMRYAKSGPKPYKPKKAPAQTPMPVVLAVVNRQPQRHVDDRISRRPS